MRIIKRIVVISEDNRNTTLYVDPVQKHDMTDADKLEIWEPYRHTSAPMLRKTVTLNKHVKSARLYVTGCGTYEFYINSKRVGNDYLNSGWTDSRYRINYKKRYLKFTNDTNPIIQCFKICKHYSTKTRCQHFDSLTAG